MANRLPPATRVDQRATRALWQEMEKGGYLKTMQPAARQLLIKAYEECEGRPGEGGMITTRECVSQMHDRFLYNLNMKYWDEVRGAS